MSEWQPIEIAPKDNKSCLSGCHTQGLDVDDVS